MYVAVSFPVVLSSSFSCLASISLHLYLVLAVVYVTVVAVQISLGLGGAASECIWSSLLSVQTTPKVPWRASHSWDAFH